MLTRWKHIRAVKLLQFVSTLLGLSVPKLYDYKGLSLLYLTYVVLIYLTVSPAYIWWPFMRAFSHKVVLSSKVLDILNVFVTFIANSTAVFRAILFKRKNIIILNLMLDDLEQQMEEKYQDSIRYDETDILVQLIVFFTCFFLMSIFDWYESNLNQSNYYIMIISSVTYLYICAILIIILQIHFYSTRIRCMLQYLHRKIYEEIRPVFVSSRLDTDYVMKYMSMESIFFIRKHDDMCDAINEVNNIYGYQIFFVVTCIVMNIINSLNVLLKGLLKVQNGTFAATQLVTFSLKLAFYIVSI